MKNRIMYIAGIIFIIASISSVAMARGRSSDRNGFNFGTSVKMQTGDDRTFSGGDSDKNVQVKSSSQSINPYMGYSINGLINLGIVVMMDDIHSETIEKSQDGNQELIRKKDTTSKGASLFGRFLFGKVMFLELGGGVYHEKTKFENETKSNTEDGAFEGQREEYDVTGIGPGYHFGGGVEIPMGGGFYFSTAYLVKVFQLRNSSDGNTGGLDLFGKKRAYDQRRELQFGVSHFID